MVQALKANKVTLANLESHFGLVLARTPEFFPEWTAAAGEMTAEEIQALERVKSNFEHLLKEPPLLEGAVKMVVLSPLLDLAGFYQPPIRLETETEIGIASTDEEGVVIKGAIDVLVVSGMLWVLVIESKMSDFSLTKALPQALSYMLSSPNLVCFGLITNGSDFVFLKLNRAVTPPQYATSKVFSLLTPGNELVEVLPIIKYLGQFVVTSFRDEN